MKRGFSLIETLVTLLLVGIVFGAVMTLLTSGLRIFRETNERDEAAQAATIGLDRLLCEFREATAVTEPGASPTLQIAFLKADIGNPLRIPTTGMPNPNWDTPAFYLQILYRVDTEGRLLRQIGVQQGGVYTETSQLADHCTGLKATRRGTGVYAVELSVRYKEIVRTSCGTVLCPALR